VQIATKDSELSQRPRGQSDGHGEWHGFDGRVILASARLTTRIVVMLSLGGVFGITAALAEKSSPSPLQTNFRLAEFGSDAPSADARHLADWIADTRDNGTSDFIIIDKRHARVYVFDAKARLRGANPVLLGAARGDDSVPGIGLRPIAEGGRNLKGEDIVWVDYDAAVSMHRVRATKPSEQRLERLATPTVDDNRISYGCINVPVAFYETHVRPTVAKNRAIVYVLPEVKPVQQVFGSYDVAKVRRHAAFKTR